jgi:hypothetical protein
MWRLQQHICQASAETVSRWQNLLLETYELKAMQHASTCRAAGKPCKWLHCIATTAVPHFHKEVS